jgi:RHS repeat-associated protein
MCDVKDDYYPFGLTFNSYQRESSEEQNRLYNGKELQDELDLDWLDFDVRSYYPALGRFLSIDIATDLLNSASPYNFALDNPVVLSDPSGMFPEDNVKNKAQDFHRNSMATGNGNTSSEDMDNSTVDSEGNRIFSEDVAYSSTQLFFSQDVDEIDVNPNYYPITATLIDKRSNELSYYDVSFRLTEHSYFSLKNESGEAFAIEYKKSVSMHTAPFNIDASPIFSDLEAHNTYWTNVASLSTNQYLTKSVPAEITRVLGLSNGSSFRKGTYIGDSGRRILTEPNLQKIRSRIYQANMVFGSPLRRSLRRMESIIRGSNEGPQRKNRLWHKPSRNERR